MTERSSPEGPAAVPLRRRSLLASAALVVGTPVATAAAAPAPQRPEPGRLPPPQSGTAVRLVAVPHRDRDVDWLRAALQAAVEIEIATIPPYLCGWWSVKDRRSDVARVIQRIVFDEMYHLGVVCNLLVALDGRPRIKEGAPVYPGPLPGGVHPGARVYLSGLTPALVHDVMMAIEAPAAPVTGSVDDPLSIGVFYEEVLKTFRTVGPELSTRRQLNERIGGDLLKPVATLDDIEHAIEIVREQGEGTSSSPADAPGDDHVAHYYAFAEIYYGRRLRETEEGWQFTGAPVPFPDARPMARVPAGGWDQPPPEVQRLLSAFDSTYTAVLEALDAAWADGGPGSLNTAVRTMRRLESPAVELMEIPIPGTLETYGPQFRPS